MMIFMRESSSWAQYNRHPAADPFSSLRRPASFIIPLVPRSTSGMAADSSRSLTLQSRLQLVEGVVPGRLAMALVMLLALVLPPATAAAQSFDPSSSTFILRGMAARKNPGTPGGAAWGSVTFGAAGEVTGGNLTRTLDVTRTFTDTFSSFAVDGRAVDGVFGTGSDPTSLLVTGVAATNDLLFLSTETPISPDYPGMLVGVRQAGTFATSDLAGTTWRFKALGVRVPLSGGDGGWAFGSLTLAADATVTTGTIAYSDATPSSVVSNGAFSITAQGAVTGSFDADMLGACDNGAIVDGAMTPDKTLIAAVITLICDDDTVASGVVIFQRDPGPTTYSLVDLAGTYDFIGIDQHSDNDNVGTWARGDVTFDGTGAVSAGAFFDPDAGTTVPTGSVGITTQGFVCSGDAPCADVFTLSSDVELHGTMTADKRIMFGVWSRDDDGVPHTAFFAWVKRPPPATISFSASAYAELEANILVTVTVERTGDTTSRVTVDYATDTAITGVPATAGADYIATSGTLTFAASEASRTFAVMILDDAEVEAAERVKLVLSNPTNGALLGSLSTAHVRITSDDSVVRFSAAVHTRAENAGATSIDVTRTGYRGSPASVTYTIGNSTATAGFDYSATASGVLSFPPGVASVPLPLTILQDTLAEGPETIELVLSAPTGAMQLGTNASTVVTITDDDDAGVLAFSAELYAVTEGEPTAVIRVVRTGGAASGVTVQYAASNGTAAAGADYTATTGTLSFGTGQMSRTFMVPIVDDRSVEGLEAVRLTLSNPGGGGSLGTPSTAVLRIRDDDSRVGFRVRAYWVYENGGATNFVDVVRTGSLAGSATVRYTITGGTATADLDYTAATSGVLTFMPGVASVPVPITILDDTLAEGEELAGFPGRAETIVVVLSAPTGTRVSGTAAYADVIITDDDTAGILAFSAETYTASEGGRAALITVVRTGGSASGVTVQYATSNGTATSGSDYTATRGMLTFAAGDSTATFRVPVVDDSTGERSETVRLTLSNPTGGASLGTPTTARLTIADNEPVVQFTGNWVGGSFEVRRTGPADVTVTVEYAATDGTAVAGVDYEPLAGTLNFAPGVTTRVIPIRIIRDTLVEGDETFTLFLRNPVGARLGAYRTHLMVIKDND
jgi:hypothetical protein